VLRSRGDAEGDEVALVAIFDGIELESRSTASRGGSMFTWFGGTAVDLGNVKLAPDVLWGVAVEAKATDTRFES